MLVRLFNPATDTARVIELYQNCFAESPWHERFDAAELEAEFREMHTWPDTIFLVMESDGIVIAGAIGFHVCRKTDVCERIPDQDRNSFYVAELFVDPTTRQHGVCRKMNEALLRIAWRFGFRRASVRTSEAQAIIQHLFVDKMQFRIVNRQDVVSTKWIEGEERQVPDHRVLMVGEIPPYDQEVHPTHVVRNECNH